MDPETQHIKAVRSATKNTQGTGVTTYVHKRHMYHTSTSSTSSTSLWACRFGIFPPLFSFFLSGKSGVLKGCVVELLVFALYEFKFGASVFLDATYYPLVPFSLIFSIFSKHPIFWNGNRGNPGNHPEAPEGPEAFKKLRSAIQITRTSKLS